MPNLAIVIPTIPGREVSLARSIASYQRHTHGIDATISVYPNSPSSGEGWRKGLEAHVEQHGRPDLIHFTNDDCEITNNLWWKACEEACEAGFLPCPVVTNPDGSLQSAGGQLGAPDDLIKHLGPDWSFVGFTTVPVLSWQQWERIGMLDIHYGSDVWVSLRGQQLGIHTALRHDYAIRHHYEQVGRGAGMSQAERTLYDRKALEAALA